MTHVNLYSDGAARGNPGPGGYGVVLTFTDAQGQLHTKELSQGYICTTNNRMEIMAVMGQSALKMTDEFVEEFGNPSFGRIDAPCKKEQKHTC